MPNRPETAALYGFDDFTVDTGQRTLTRGAEALPLPSRAFDTLAYLISQRGRCVPKDELIAAIWHDVVVTDDSLIHAVSVLRRALGDGRSGPRYIQTVPRRGYRFIAPVTELADAAPELARPEAVPAAAVPPSAGPSAGQSAGPSAGRSAGRTAGRSRPRGRPGLAQTGAVAGFTGAVAAVLVLIVLDRQEAPAPREPVASIRLYQTAPAGTRIVSGGALSPDSSQLAFVARDEGRGVSALWVRTLATSQLRRLEGTDGASKPFWSPDSNRLGYFANGAVFTIDLVGGAPRIIAPVFAAAGGTWSEDGTILFAEWTSGLFAAPASGDGDVVAVATLDRHAQDIALGWPQFLPGGRQFIYQIVSLDGARSGVFAGDLDGGEPVRLLATESPAVLAPPNYLLHVRDDMLIAEQYDRQRLVLTGLAFIVARGMSPMTLAAENIVSASADLLAFQQGVVHQNLGWFDRNGMPLGTLSLPTALFNPRISPDGSRLLASSTVTSNPGLWLAHLDRERFSRLETDAIGPVWSHDGQWIAFTSRQGLDLVVRAADGDERQVLASDDSVKILNDWSPDGTRLVYTKHDTTTGLDLWVVDALTGVSRRLLATPHNETQARISADGRWIAYAADDSGVLETYVARFPGLEQRQKISVAGGGQPQWRADGGEVYYLSLDQAVMAVAVRQGDPPAFAPPARLFRAPVAGDPADAREYYAAAADGTRFLIDGAVSDNDGESITIMVNWAEGSPARRYETALREPAAR